MSQPDLLAGLNPEQRAAVTHPGGPALVIAGAGSGKTRVLTHRIAHLIFAGTPARNILAVTFTNKAAAEMKRRLESLCGAAGDLWIGTFHAMCARFLRLEIAKMGMNNNFTILDDQDQLTVIKEAMRELKLDDKSLRPNGLRERIGRAKNRLLTPQQLRTESPDAADQVTAAVYQEYQKMLFANNALDFDDLIMATVKLLQKDPELHARYASRFGHVLIDEYQDTNHAQYTLAQLLASQNNNVFAVGDEDQSIYSFRGAEINNILDFERAFPGTTLYRLQQNYRSTQHILNAANALIRNNRQRKGKILWTENGDGEKVTLFRAADEHREVEFILSQIESLQSAGEAILRDVVIFYRVHALSRVLEEGLRRTGIPYEIIGGIGFYERREIKDALAYLRSVSNPSDSISLRRILNVPARGIGEGTMKILNEICSSKNISLVAAMETALEHKLLPPKASQGVLQLLQCLRKGALEKERRDITGLLEWVLEESGYMAELRREKSIESRTRMENLKELGSATEEFQEQNTGAKLEDFLNDIALWSNMDKYKEADDKITLMSLHSSKGLEFPCVFIAGLEEGVFPYSYWGMDPNDLEEERRLLYVGMTRARKRLFLSCAQNRMLFGTRKFFEPSRFVAEIQGEFLVTHGMEARAADRTSLYDDGDAEDDEISIVRAPVLSRVTVPATHFGEGENIIHPQFGRGRIMTCYDSGENLKVSIKFQSEESPRLLAVKYANLKKVQV